MNRRLFILMFTLTACLSAVGCRPLMLWPSDNQANEQSDSLDPIKKRPLPVDQRPTGTSDRAREIERSLGMGR